MLAFIKKTAMVALFFIALAGCNHAVGTQKTTEAAKHANPETPAGGVIQVVSQKKDEKKSLEPVGPVDNEIQEALQKKEEPKGVDPDTATDSATQGAMPKIKDEPELTTVPHNSGAMGALQVKGDTQDWFSVSQNGKNAIPGNPPLLNGTIDLLPGIYVVSVNNTKRTVTIKAGEKTILLTGSLVVEGKGSWWTPYQGKETALAGVQPILNSPVALFAGTYSVTVSTGLQSVNITDSAQVAPGKKTVLKH